MTVHDTPRQGGFCQETPDGWLIRFCVFKHPRKRPKTVRLFNVTPHRRGALKEPFQPSFKARSAPFTPPTIHRLLFTALGSPYQNGLAIGNGLIKVLAAMPSNPAVTAQTPFDTGHGSSNYRNPQCDGIVECQQANHS